VATWHTLPLEIQDRILKFFCKYLIAHYKFQYASFEIAIAWIGLRPLSWPASPQPLIDFSSALRTSRSFYHSIHGLRINGESPVRQLQLIQKQIFEAILREANNRLSDRDHGDDDDDSREDRVNVSLFKAFAGVFWKNPLVRERSGHLKTLLNVLDNESSVLLIPHLEQWVLEHAVPIDGLNSHDVNWYCPREDDGVVFQIGSRFGAGSLSGVLTSIEGLYEGSGFMEDIYELETQNEAALLQAERNQELIQKHHVFEELSKGSGEWWLFTLDGNSPDSSRLVWWIVVDYGGKRMWGNIFAEAEMCFWNDPWEFESWRLGGEGYSEGIIPLVGFLARRWAVWTHQDSDDDSEVRS
jgi:hypothetical protein